MDIVDPELLCHAVVVRVARNHDRLVHVHHTVAAGLPVAIAMAPAAAEEEITGIVDGVVWVALPQLQSGQSHERFEGRARWIDTLQRAVVEGMIR
jgi:CO/xanthine dehydrogenase Mo-binding subunit